ncbi:MAG: ImmA/IrrE family metallo-endopeptidase [Thermoguttaceae bacterium]
MLSEYTCEELAAGLDAVVSEILAEAGVDRPPVDAFEVARQLGIAVALDDQQAGRARYVRLGGRRSGRMSPTILLRPDVRPERQQWAVAHEIGEHAAYRVFDTWGVDPRTTSPGAREDVANQLAGRLLLPTDWFTADAAGCDWDLAVLKVRYASASNELIARRMLECGPAVLVTIFDQGKIYFRRSNLPGRTPGLSPGEGQCQRVVHECNCAHRVSEGLCRIQGWPVHEPDWKREILRMELPEWGVDLGYVNG